MINKIKVFILAFFISVVFLSTAFALNPTASFYEGGRENRAYYRWTLATNVSTSTDSTTANQIGFCDGVKTIVITTSGTVDITFTIKDGATGAAIGSSFTVSSATTTFKEADHPIETLYVTIARTTGTVDSIILICK